MHDLFFPFYSVGNEPKVITGTFVLHKALIFPDIQLAWLDNPRHCEGW